MTLNTPLLWIALPLIMAAVTGIFLNRKIFGIILTSLTAFGLALLSFFFPEELIITIGPISLAFEESFRILGRQFTLAYEILPFITLIYAMTGLWALSSAIPGVTKTFRPISLVITALLTAALGVEPFLYAALLIETAVLVSIWMLSPQESETNTGILRYLSLQTLAMPFILLAGWLLTGVESLPPDSPLVGQTMITLGLGFGLWLGVFPFHSWVPMINQRSHPLVASFLMFIFPTTVLLFSLNFIDRYTFLRTSQNLFEVLRIIGTLMILLGGLWTAFQKDLKRAFGFSVLTETGFSLLAIGFMAQGGLEWLLMLFPIRALGFWLWGYTLALFEANTGNLTTLSIQGFARQYPLLSMGLLLAQLSVAGLPLLGAFPVKIALFTAAFDLGNGLGWLTFIGNLGLFLFTLRLLAYMVSPIDPTYPTQWQIRSKAHEFVPILIAIVVIVILGLFPHTILSGITNTLTAFTQLQ